MIRLLCVDIYSVAIVVAIEPTIDEWKKFRKKYKKCITDNDEEFFLADFNNQKECSASTIQLDGGDYLIFIRNKESHGDIAHEIFHACNNILVERDFTHDTIAEPWAYLIGYVTDKFYDML
jgi:hypothetical protein